MEISNVQNDIQVLYNNIKEILINSRAKAYSAVNTAMVVAYWEIGKIIVERQDGNATAEYGSRLLEGLSKQMTAEFGKGFTVANLKNMRQFYLTFPNRYALRSELTWTHYRLIMRVESEKARLWYMNEAANEQWSSRQLDRQISTLYYERLLSSKDTTMAVQEANEKLKTVAPEQFIKDPYVLDFLDLKNYPSLRETTLKAHYLTNCKSFYWN